MEAALIYLLKSAGLISLFYAGYYLLLRNDTNFVTNRVFLLSGILTSLVLPLFHFTRVVEVQSSGASFFPENFSAEVLNSPAGASEIIDWWQTAGIIYLLGLSFFLLKFFLELFFLLKLIYTHNSISKEDHILIPKAGTTQPFSFFHYVVLDPNQHDPAELDLILKHELSHRRQWHSIDQILSSLFTAVLWFNPLSWSYRKSIVQNLEYLADKEVVAEKVSKREYQQTLLKICVADFKPALSNQFYQSFIKKRIMMLNKNTTQKSNVWKLSLILPFLAVFIFIFNVETIAQEVQKKTESPNPAKANANREIFNDAVKSEFDDIPAIHRENTDVIIHAFQETKPLIVVDGKRVKTGFDLNSIDPSSIDNIKVLKDKMAIEKYGEAGRNGVIEIYLRSGDTLRDEKPTSEEKENATTIKVTKYKFEESPKLSVRDVGSANPDASTPLYIVDGKEMGKDFDAETVAPEDIESVTVLKGEQATTKYGDKAKAGAIEITLKKE